MGVLLLLEVLAALVAVLITSFIAYWIYLKYNNYWVDKNIPFESPVPIFGAVIELLKGKSFYEVDQEFYKKYGKLFGVYTGFEPNIYVADPELLKLVFVKDFHLFSTRRSFTTGIALVDNMISIVKGEQWRNIRHTITPAFSSGKLKNMIPFISECAKISTNNFVKYAEDSKVVNCKKLYGNFTLDVIANVAFGTRLDSHNDPNNKFVVHASKFFGTEVSVSGFLSFLFPRLAKLFGISFFPLATLDFFKETTESIIKRRKEYNEVRPDFLQLMIDSQKPLEEAKSDIADHQSNTEASKGNLEKVEQIKRKPLTEDEALSQCILFFIAGYDSTATTLTMVSYYLALNPDVQDKVLEEVDRIWKKRDVLDSEALLEAKYIEATIDETLRMCPPAIRLERTAEKDCELGDTGIPLKKNMIIAIPVYAMHHDPQLFPEPERFKPERFIPKDYNEIKPYTYLPFGAGPRNCVAMRLALMELKLCLLNVLRSVKFSTCPETKIPAQFLKGSALLQPVDVILKVSLR